MKKLLMTSAILLCVGGSAFAQNATGTGTATANSGSSSSAGAIAGAYSEGGVGGTSILYVEGAPAETRATTTLNQNVRTSGSTTVREQQSGTVRNEFAPAVSAPAMGSGHPCGLGNSIGISVIGGGVTGGATRVDDACLLGQMGYRRAATAMIAARNPAACAALVATGEISPDSNCGDGTRTRGGIMRGGSSSGPARGATPGEPIAVGQRPGPSAGNVAPVLAVAGRNQNVCRIKEGTTRVIQTSATTEQGRMACAASLGF
jgi:hypothetical protein